MYRIERCFFFLLALVVAANASAAIEITSIDSGTRWPVRIGRWQPVFTIVRNTGDRPVAGVLEVSLPRNTSGTIGNRIRVPAVIPPRTRHRIVTLCPVRTTNAAVTATFYDEDGAELSTMKGNALIASPAEMSALILDDTVRGYDVLTDRIEDIDAPYDFVQSVSIAPVNLPTRVQAYDGVDIMAIGNIDPTTITPDAAEAVDRFVRGGGLLICLPGKHADRYRGTFLAEMLPVVPVGHRAVKDVKALERFTGYPIEPTGFIDFCEAVARPEVGAVVEVGGEQYPVIVSRPYGLGSVIFVACRFDDFGRQWPGREALRRQLFVRSRAPITRDTAAFHQHGRQYVQRLIGNKILTTGSLSLLLVGYAAALLLGLAMVRRTGRGEWGLAVSLPVAGLAAVTLAFAGGGDKTVQDTQVSISVVELDAGSSAGMVRSLTGFYAAKERDIRLVGASDETVFDQVLGDLIRLRCPHCGKVFEAGAAEFNARRPCYVCGSRFITCPDPECGELIAVTSRLSAENRLCNACGVTPISPDSEVTSPRTVTFVDDGSMSLPHETIRTGSLVVFSAAGWMTIDGAVTGSVRLTSDGLEGTVTNKTGGDLIDAFVVWNDLVAPIGDLPKGASAEVRSGGAATVGRPELTASRVRSAEMRLRMQAAADLMGVDERPSLAHPPRPVLVAWSRTDAAPRRTTGEGDAWSRRSWTMLAVALDVDRVEGDTIKVPAGVVPAVGMGIPAERFYKRPSGGGVFDEAEMAGGYRSNQPSVEGETSELDFVFQFQGPLGDLRPTQGEFRFDAEFVTHTPELHLYNVSTGEYDVLPWDATVTVSDLTDYFDPASGAIELRVAVRYQPPMFREARQLSQTYWTIRRVQAAFDAKRETNRP